MNASLRKKCLDQYRQSGSLIAKTEYDNLTLNFIHRKINRVLKKETPLGAKNRLINTVLVETQLLDEIARLLVYQQLIQRNILTKASLKLRLDSFNQNRAETNLSNQC